MVSWLQLFFLRNVIRLFLASSCLLRTLLAARTFLDLVFSWQVAERELSLVVTLHAWTPGKFTWARRKN